MPGQINPSTRRYAIRTSVRVNHRIRVLQVRCISETGEQLGVISTSEALKLAEARGLDLVEISPRATPPVCRIMDFGKYRYEESRKEKIARKRQVSIVVKEMKFHANVEEHDYQTKLAHIQKFLQKGYRVKASLMFRGRENEHRELGYALINRMLKDCEPWGVADAPPRAFGNNLLVFLRPLKS